MLSTIDSNKFNHKNKIDKFKYIDIKDLVDNVRNDAISEIHAKKDLSTLNEIKNTQIIKYKRRTLKQKELLNLFNDLLDTILTDKTLKSKSQKYKTLMSSNENDDNEMNKTLMSSNEDDDGTINQNNNNLIKQLNDSLDEMVDESILLEDQIKLIRKVGNWNEYYFINDYGNKELEFKIFKLELASLSNIFDKKIFKRIFGHTLANKLINTTNKEENQIIIKNVSRNKEKLYEEDETGPFYDYVIQPSDGRNNSIDAINLFLNFNEIIQLNLVWKYKKS